MDLRETAEETAFRNEARDWLSANVPGQPLPSFDTEIGFARHREWERKLYEGRWSAVSWPEQYGGRGADYVFEVVGRSETIRSAFAMTRRAGTCTIVGAGRFDDTVGFGAMALMVEAKTASTATARRPSIPGT